MEGIKPIDISLLIKLVANQNRSWKQVNLAHDLGVSQSDVAKSLSRLRKLQLVVDYKPVKKNALELLKYSVKFLFPVEVGRITRGVPTSISAPVHGKVVVYGNSLKNKFVWPYYEGGVEGQMVEPIHSSIPRASLLDAKYYEIASAIDMLRVGKAREKNAAIQILEGELL